MKTVDFVSDIAQVEAWLKSESALLEQKGAYVSFWLHSDVFGFGIVISDVLCENSGEFHLMPDSSVTRHVKKLGEVVLDEQVEAAEFGTFVDLFNDFKSRILYSLS